MADGKFQGLDIVFQGVDIVKRQITDPVEHQRYYPTIQICSNCKMRNDLYVLKGTRLQDVGYLCGVCGCQEEAK